MIIFNSLANKHFFFESKLLVNWVHARLYKIVNRKYSLLCLVDLSWIGISGELQFVYLPYFSERFNTFD